MSVAMTLFQFGPPAVAALGLVRRQTADTLEERRLGEQLLLGGVATTVIVQLLDRRTSVFKSLRYDERFRAAHRNAYIDLRGRRQRGKSEAQIDRLIEQNEDARLWRTEARA